MPPFLILSSIFCPLGLILLLLGTRMVYVRASKLLRCTQETEGRAVDFILSKWKSVPMDPLPGHFHGYTPRWFPVYEYCAGGQRFVQRSKVCILSVQRPQAYTVTLRYDPRKAERYYVPGEFTLTGWAAAALFLWVGGMFTAAGLIFLAAAPFPG